MENASVWRVKKSLGLSLGLIWSIGVPNVKVHFIRRFMYTLILLLIFFALYGITLSHTITLTISVAAPDTGVIILKELFACIFSHVIMIVWLTRGARIFEDTIMELSRLDIVLRDFGMIEKNLNLRRNQIFSIGLLLMWCSLDFISNLIQRDLSRETSPAVATDTFHYAPLHWACAVTSRLQLLTLDIFFLAVMTAIRHRLQRVNMKLYKMGNVLSTEFFYPTINRREQFVVPCNDRSQTTECRVEELVSELDLLWEMHKRLCKITEKFSSVFSVTLLIAFLIGLATCLEYAYIMSVMALYGSSRSSYIVFFISVFTLLFIIIRTWILVGSCNALVIEAHKFGSMLHRINFSGLDFYRKLRELSMKHYQDKLEIVACGFLPVDFTWLTLIFFIVTAYAVLIIQLGKRFRSSDLPLE